MNFKTIGLSLILSWYAFPAASESNSAKPDLPCAKTLKPCLNLKPPVEPPITCCRPLKEMIGEDVKCLCTALRNETYLNKYNTTRADALKLVTACKIEANLSLCIPGSSTRDSRAKNAADKRLSFVVSLFLAAM